MALAIGLTHSNLHVVKPEESAAKVGSGLVDVYATPAMIALCEKTASETVQPDLAENEVTVGTEIHINHTNAVKIGKEVKCTAQLIKIEGRKLEFTVSAESKGETIGKGTHLRFIVDKEKFMQPHFLELLVSKIVKISSNSLVEVKL